MKTVGIIAEYNPFHLGHKYQIDKIRETFGEDTVIVAVMSGNITQRGEIAIFDKATRAEAAVNCGVNLVLELPFPHCASGAQFFAEGGVNILNALGAIDYLSFGSECGSVDELTRAAEILDNDNIEKSETHDAIGYAKKCENLYTLEDGGTEIFTSNNILGIEYIKALKRINRNIIPTTVKREGDAYTLKSIDSSFASAMAIRERLLKNDISAFDYVPKEAKEVFLKAIEESVAPCLASALDSAVISSLRLNTPKSTDKKIHDAEGGLYNRIQAKSFNANSISSLIEQVKTKKYTTARIRRAIWYAYFGVTSSEVHSAPRYTQILAMDEKGAALLKRIKKTSSIPLLTKPSATESLDSQALSSKSLSDRVDSVLQLTKPGFVNGDAGLRFTPFVKK